MPGRWSESLRAAFVLGTVCLGCAAATPTVDVALRAAFPRPPLLLELLESAADENSTAYFPLLDRVAGGAFNNLHNDQQLYIRFLQILQDEGHLVDPQALSSWKLAVAIHSTAPRIEAQYQFYKSSIEPSLSSSTDVTCGDLAVLDIAEKRYCSAQDRTNGFTPSRPYTEALAFDRITSGGSYDSSYILYADPTSHEFGADFRSVRTGIDSRGRSTFRLRYKPSKDAQSKPLSIHGYGVALDLKRTDYLVIDDRQDEAQETIAASTNTELASEDEEVSDLRKLTSAELLRLDLRAASYIMNAEDKLETLLRVTQDFPKHAASISAFNVSDDFVKEHNANREQMLTPGFNVLWINGQQYDARKMNPFDLLEHIRKERAHIAQAQSLGLTAAEMIELLMSPAITDAQINDEPIRYDWRDEVEGRNIVIWLNNIEKDKRYLDWDSKLSGFLQRTFPGQMPAVRRDVHNVVMPIDFTDADDVETVVERLQTFVKRKPGPVRFGVVPVLSSPEARLQAKVVYFFAETYGLAALMQYLTASLQLDALSTPDSSAFDLAVQSAKLLPRQSERTLADVLQVEHYSTRIKLTGQYLSRVGADGVSPVFFTNGVALPWNTQWLSAVSQRISADLRAIQQLVYEGTVEEDFWLPQFFLEDALLHRNALIIPEDPSSIRLLNLVELATTFEAVVQNLPRIAAQVDVESNTQAQLIVIDDFDSKVAKARLKELLAFRKEIHYLEILFLNSRPRSKVLHPLVDKLSHSVGSPALLTIKEIEDALKAPSEGESSADATSDGPQWKTTKALLTHIGVSEGQAALIINGRLISPINDTVIFSEDDYDTLVSYEQKDRIAPVTKALMDLGLNDKVPSVDVAAKLCSLVSISTISTVPAGIYEDHLPSTRSNVFDRVWTHNSTAVIAGDASTASIRLIAVLDPASEVAQRWAPILSALSKFEGVYTRLYLNPRDRISELPVKRFYRYALESEPSFGTHGELQDVKVNFKGIPSETLLTMAMDVPPSWLVAPEDSIYDLDNIKLSSVSSPSVNAVYKLENILIEGHTRDVASPMPPRGAKLELGTEKNPHFADTIIMANLGYFQFKANPGVYQIKLQEGASRDIFQIDSIGAQDGETASDEKNEVALTSFQGLTLFPKMSRKPGKETDDVLEAPASSTADLASKGAAAVDGLLAKVGVKKADTGHYVSKAIDFASNLITKYTPLALKNETRQADINIFSVASGHLYERMLNIMMVSVMRHTNHTVKFWFIEQFLSPSFKSFLPTMAATYGFKYELVTYKWPHWLRQQKEKQREIWGYKILFLDVLFPLDLDKVIFVDADQIVRTDMYELVELDLQGAPYGFTPMCDSRTEMEGFRFWKQGYWQNFLRGLPYHISALYVVDLKRFRQIAAGDRLRQQYHQLSSDPGSLSNLDQDLPNNMQFNIPIHSLPQEWLWCETWCSDESLKDAKTIDLCNNPQTKEPKLERARRQVPEWTEYDDEIAALAERTKGFKRSGGKEQERQQELEYSSAKGSAAATATAASEQPPEGKDEL